MEFRTAVLPNGLEIVAETSAEAYSTALAFFVKTGARDETDAEAGVSHFLEHMAFKGTATRSADDVNREFDELGAQYNAFTSEENTVFHAAILPELQGPCLRLLADILRPAVRPDDFEVEKQVILEEIQMYEDQPPFGADEKCRAAYFGPHPLGRSVLGTARSIEAMDVEAMRDYVRRRYGPENIVLAAAGRVDFDALVADARAACGAWDRSEGGRIAQPARPRPGFHGLRRPAATQQYTLQLAAAPAAGDADRYAAKLLAMVLGDDSGSRLYWELIDSGLAEQAEISHCEYEGAGVFFTFMSCAPEQTAENLRRIRDLYRAAHADSVTAAEIRQAKSKVRSRLVLTSERPRDRLFMVGADWVYRRQYRTIREDLDLVAVLRVEDVTDVLRRYPLTSATTLTVGPQSDIKESS
ncbi:MAG: pitrilysin family protein [Thermoguttaceae bacterium]